MKIQKAKGSDLNQLSKLASSIPLFQEYGMTLKGAQKTFSRALAHRDSEVWVAKEKSSILGFAWIVKKGAFDRSAYLRLIAASPEAIGRKVGRTLLLAMEKRFLKPHGLFLLVTSTNRRAIGFYKGMGYRKIGVLESYMRKGFSELIYFKAP